MAFISYAQNFEDVMLYRVFKDIKQGFYIDVGANDPVIDSVTKAFYDLGWSGVNIEPVSEWFDKLKKDRLKDINLQFVVGEKKEKVDFYEIVGTGLSTLDSIRAKRYKKDDGFELKKHQMPMVNLNSICEKYSPKDIHFLKIDVEGAELSVLKGLDLKKFRPWVILVETTTSTSQIQNHKEWEILLLDKYDFVYFDGLNRHYLSKEHIYLKSNYDVPPNIFDDFTISGTANHTLSHLLNTKITSAQAQAEIEAKAKESAQAQAEIEAKAKESAQAQAEIEAKAKESAQAQAEIEAKAKESAQAQAEIEAKAKESAQAQAEIEAKAKELAYRKAEKAEIKISEIYNSRSWRITQPLRKLAQLSRKSPYPVRVFIRWFFRLVKRLINFFIRLARSLRLSNIKYFFKLRIVFFLKSLKVYIYRHIWLKQATFKFLRAFPRLSFRLKHLLLSPVHDKTDISLLKSNDHSKDILNSSDYVKDSQRIILYYVEHTAKYDLNTGVQRVCRKLAKALSISTGEKIILVKIDCSTLEFAPLNEEERDKFSRWSGLKVSESDIHLYEPVVFNKIVENLTYRARPPWLLIPEVSYHSFLENAPTHRLIKLARNYGMRVGAIFYDAIPLIDGSSKLNAEKHCRYQSALGLVDIVWSISNLSSLFLVDFFKRYEKLEERQLPQVSINSLPEEFDSIRGVAKKASTSRVILCVGTIDERKNQFALIEAFNRYCKEHPKSTWILQLVGMVRDEYRQRLKKELKNNHLIELYEKADDNLLIELYRKCDFTVFPSTNEGYGLPIVESLWHFRPCICANYDVMGELAKDGGCLAVDTHKVDELYNAVLTLITDEHVRKNLVREILKRRVKSWYDYANVICNEMTDNQYGKNINKTIYYWLDATVASNSNTGIQRVCRQLAKELMQTGERLIPIKWDDVSSSVISASENDLIHMERWNGPLKQSWTIDTSLEESYDDSIYLMVDLPLNRPIATQRQVISYFKKKNIPCAAIFYDAIPVKLGTLYPAHFSDAHSEYMELLDKFDLVMPISNTSATDLKEFLRKGKSRSLAIEQRVKVVELASEFPTKASHDDVLIYNKDSCNILVVGTVEPRKNHVTLIEAFLKADKISSRKLKLTIVGGDDSFDKVLPHKITDFIKDNKNIKWFKDADDSMLKKLYSEAEFTVYPSIEEGYGLPIAESLWFGKPCICANFGQMGEIAKNGGCLTVNVKHADELGESIVLLANNFALFKELKQKAIERYFKTWREYGNHISSCLSDLVPNLVSTDEYNNSDTVHYYVPEHPVLSVCITTYNRAEWLRINLNNWVSLFDDSNDQVELIVCDNHSTDKTQSVVKDFIYRKDINFYRNSANIGMLGNLAETVSFARGEYVWLIGDDDIIHDGAVREILKIINKNSPELININYSYATDLAPPKFNQINKYLSQATSICDGEKSHSNAIKNISAYNENFFTAIYTFVLKRKHSLSAFTQNTSGVPFSNMQSCVPSSKYILSKLMNNDGYWLNDPKITVNLNVSWGQYAPIWILDRIPEVYDVAEYNGVDKEKVNRWRLHTLDNTVQYFEILFNDMQYSRINLEFDMLRFIGRYRHLKAFHKIFPQIESIYVKAREEKHPLAKWSVGELKLCLNNSIFLNL